MREGWGKGKKTSRNATSWWGECNAWSNCKIPIKMGISLSIGDGSNAPKSLPILMLERARSSRLNQGPFGSWEIQHIQLLSVMRNVLSKLQTSKS
jgi:hypothetical protein